MRYDEEQKLLSRFMLRRAVPDVLALDIENLKEMHLHPLTNFVTLGITPPTNPPKKFRASYHLYELPRTGLYTTLLANHATLLASNHQFHPFFAIAKLHHISLISTRRVF